MAMAYCITAVAIVLVAIYVRVNEDRTQDQLQQQHEILGRLIKLMDQQDAINAANRQFADSAMGLFKAQAKVIDDNTVKIEALAKSDLSL